MMKKLFYFFVLIFLSSFVSAAIIHGTIYDLSISKVDNVIVEINTNPQQRYVAVNGTYSFQVPTGRYTITTQYLADSSMYAEENITIIDGGKYILDLFLYPDIEENLIDDLDFEIVDPYEEKNYFWFLFPLAVVMIIFLFVLLKLNKKLVKEEIKEENKLKDEDLSKMLDLLKKNNKRMTQKEIRKHFPLSEAKISLMIAELESLNKVKKIKKGRGNIIVLK